MFLSRLFPAAYILLWLPAALLASGWVQAAIIGAALMTGLLANALTMRRYAQVVFPALLVFSLLLSVVRAAECSAKTLPTGASLASCTASSALPWLNSVAALFAVVMMAAAVEWRGSLTRTVNGLALPRQLRALIAMAGAMIGEIRRVIPRVYHAATARGDAAPGRSLRNLTALSRVASPIWSSLLVSLVPRMRHQWASEAFWERYVPRSAHSLRNFALDAVVLIAGVAAISAAISFSFFPS